MSPNPVSGKMVNLQFTNQRDAVCDIRLINTIAQVVKTLLTKHAGGSSFDNFTISSLYPCVRVRNNSTGLKQNGFRS